MYRVVLLMLIPGILFLTGCDSNSQKNKPHDAASEKQISTPEKQTKPSYSKKTYKVGPRPSDPICTDLNGDGANDIAVALKKQALSVLVNKGNGDLSTPVLYETMPHNISLTKADIDNDGDMDLIPLTERRVGPVFLNDGKGNFKKTDIEIMGLPFSWHIEAADLNNDNLPDLVISGIQTPKVMVLMNKGDLTFEKGIYDLFSALDLDIDKRLSTRERRMSGSAPAHGSSSFSASHLSGNATKMHRSEMEVSNQFIRKTIIHKDTENRTKICPSKRLRLSKALRHLPNGIKDFVLTDINGDGHVDMILPSYIMNAVYTGINDGKGNFEFFETCIQGQEIIHNTLSSVALLKNKGKKLPDVAISSENHSQIYIFENRQGKLFYQKTIETGVGLPLVRIASADLNQDGLSDIIGTFSAPIPKDNKSSVLIWFNKDGDFVPGNKMKSDGYGAYIDVCSLDDGPPTIIISNLHEESITLLKPSENQ